MDQDQEAAPEVRRYSVVAKTPQHDVVETLLADSVSVDSQGFMRFTVGGHEVAIFGPGVAYHAVIREMTPEDVPSES